MEYSNKDNKICELSDNEANSINGGGPILEGAAWLFGFLSVVFENADTESMKAVNSPITGPGGNKYM